jgi:hypothetical protein
MVPAAGVETEADSRTEDMDAAAGVVTEAALGVVTEAALLEETMGTVIMVAAVRTVVPLAWVIVAPIGH